MATTGSPALTQTVLCRRLLQPGQDWTLLAIASKQDHEFQGRTVHWRKEEQAKDYSSGRGKYKWHREVPTFGDWQIQETLCL